jgi:hypothetical protein
MRVYLAAAMTNPNRDLPSVQAILRHIESLGHQVPTRHVAFETGGQQDAKLSDSQLANRDLTWIHQADALIAEVSTPSHGVGIEVAAALQRPIPVLLLFHRSARVSRLLLGLPGSDAIAYDNPEEAAVAVSDFMAALSSS